MPKPSDYTPARRYIMQGVMWLILAGTIALAAVVGESVRRANRIDLSPQSINVGDISVRLPAKWRSKARGDDVLVIAQASETAPGDRGRVVRVLMDRLETPASPLQYIVDHFGVEVISSPDEVEDGVAAIVPVQIAGQTGVLVTAEHLLSRREGVGKTLYACAVLPSQRAIVIELHGDGPANISDAELVKQIAATVTVGGEPQIGQAGEAIMLNDGTQFIAPQEFVPVDQTDRNRTDRLLFATVGHVKDVEELESRWGTIEVVGCFCPSFLATNAVQLEQAKSAMATLLLVRDQSWRGAMIEPAGDHALRAVLAKSQGENDFPACAYLQTDAGGRAVLAVFRGGFGASGNFDDAWKELAGSVKFSDSASDASEMAHLAEVGAAEAIRLREEGLDTLLTDRDEQWWLYADQSDRPHIGWSHIEFHMDGLGAKEETRFHHSGKRITRITEEFSYKDDSDDGPLYSADVLRGDATDSSADRMQQKTIFRGGQLSVSLKLAGKPATQWKLPAPPEFIPGGVLPLVMGHLHAESMLIRTESFPGYEGIGPPEPFAVILRPQENITRIAEGEQLPMRCVSTEVNGSGRVSRWFFRQTAELECVELPGGVQRLPTEATSITVDFGKDGEMAP